MRVVMMGSGGVGGFFGGLLAAAGHDVSFIARGAHLEAMRRDGLTVERDAGPAVHVPKVRVSDDPASLGGADIVVITLHWGQEYQSKPTDGQVKLANQLLASPDIDLVVGSHVHVIQPIDRIGDKYVVYGLGNFLSNQASEAAAGLPAATQDGVIVEVDVTETGTGVFKASGVSYTPTWVNRTAGYAIIPVSAALKDPATRGAGPCRQSRSLS